MHEYTCLCTHAHQLSIIFFNFKIPSYILNQLLTSSTLDYSYTLLNSILVLNTFQSGPSYPKGKHCFIINTPFNSSKMQKYFMGTVEGNKQLAK